MLIHAEAQLGDLTQTSDGCICINDVVTYTCVTYEVGLTIWQGSVFNHCTSKGIRLRQDIIHGTKGHVNCSDGTTIQANVIFSGNHFVSVINVTVSSNVVGRSLECVYMSYDDDTNTTLIDSTIIGITGIHNKKKNNYTILLIVNLTNI